MRDQLPRSIAIAWVFFAALLVWLAGGLLIWWLWPGL